MHKAYRHYYVQEMGVSGWITGWKLVKVVGSGLKMSGSGWEHGLV